MRPDTMLSTIILATLLLGGAFAIIPDGARPLTGNAFLGFNVVNLRSGNFSDPGYLDATANLQPGILRYPPVEILRNAHFFQIERAALAQLRPGSSFLLSAPGGFLPGWGSRES